MGYFLQLDGFDPAENLAVEEYLLTGKTDDFVMLWRNGPSVIIGRNQNALAEIDFGYTRKNNIAVVRRTTGGGAVFHDAGNVNFSFIFSDAARYSDYAVLSRPIIEYLKTLSLDAVQTGRNDIALAGKKFSGAAQTVKKGRLLHHGTLLYSSDMKRLAAALRPRASKLEGKGVKSVRQRVVNLSELLEAPKKTEEFMAELGRYLVERLGLEEYELTAEDGAAVARIRAERYGRDEWNIGEDPACSATNEKRFKFGTVECSFTAERGKIAAVRFTGDFFSQREVCELERALAGTPHSFSALEQKLSEAGVGACISGATAEEIAEMFF